MRHEHENAEGTVERELPKWSNQDVKKQWTENICHTKAMELAVVATLEVAVHAAALPAEAYAAS